MGERNTRRERLVARVLVAVGVLGLLTLVALAASMGLMWRRIRADLRVPGASGGKVVHVSGCDRAFLYAPLPLEAGSAGRLSHYTLSCLGNGPRATMPTCDEVIARYVAENGPLPTDVRVTIRRSETAIPHPCDPMYTGDGTPK